MSISKNNPIKQSKLITEYEKLCGVHHGGDRKSERHNVAVITQEDIAKRIDVSIKISKNLEATVPQCFEVHCKNFIQLKNPVFSILTWFSIGRIKGINVPSNGDKMRILYSTNNRVLF